MRTTISTTARPMTAPRFSRNERQKERSGVGGACGRWTADGKVTSTGMADPRIDEAIGEIDEQVDHDDDARDQHDAGLEGRIIAPVDRFDEPFANSRPGEDGLGEDGAREQ